MSKKYYPPASLIVICLCAQWCSSCRDYRATFEELAQELPDTELLWLDIEDQAELVYPINVENFPTILIAQNNTPLFFGAITPHAQTLRRLVAGAAAGNTAALQDAEGLRALLVRLRSGTTC
jgi:thioredoxin 1